MKLKMTYLIRYLSCSFIFGFLLPNKSHAQIDTSRSEILELAFYMAPDTQSVDSTKMFITISFKIKQGKKIKQVLYTLRDSSNNILLKDTTEIVNPNTKFYNKKKNGDLYELGPYSINSTFLIPWQDYRKLTKAEVAVLEVNGTERRDKSVIIKRRI